MNRLANMLKISSRLMIKKYKEDTIQLSITFTIKISVASKLNFRSVLYTMFRNFAFRSSENGNTSTSGS